MNDVVLKIKIKNINKNRGDLKIKTEKIKIKAEEKETIKLEIPIPLDAKEGEYDLLLTVSAKDDKNIFYETEIEYELQITDKIISTSKTLEEDMEIEIKENIPETIALKNNLSEPKKSQFNTRLLLALSTLLLFILAYFITFTGKKENFISKVSK